MKNNFKLNIIIVCVGLLIVITIALYFYKIKNEKNENEFIEIEEINEIGNNLIENIREEKNNIVVHITGEVKFPGVVELKEESRIVDAIEAAGGETENADLNQLNLAYILSDGDKIYVPNKEELVKNNSDNINNISSNSDKNKLNLNSASIEDLIKLPGIGESTANKIIEYRKEKGKFKKIDELKNIMGIGESKYIKLKEYVDTK